MQLVCVLNHSGSFVHVIRHKRRIGRAAKVCFSFLICIANHSIPLSPQGGLSIQGSSDKKEEEPTLTKHGTHTLKSLTLWDKTDGMAFLRFAYSLGGRVLVKDLFVFPIHIFYSLNPFTEKKKSDGRKFFLRFKNLSRDYDASGIFKQLLLLAGPKFNNQLLLLP